MNVRRKILSVICLMSAYVHWIKPRLLSTTVASKSGKSLLLLLCGRSRFLIPMIVFTAFWIFDAQMQIEASISLTLSRNVHITLGPDNARQEVIVIEGESDDDSGEAGGDDDDENGDETYTIDSYSTLMTESDDDSDIICLDDVENALREFVSREGNPMGASFDFGNSVEGGSRYQ